MHDRWIGLLASTMGRASMLNEQTVLYRQHDRNVVGTGQKATGPEDGKISFLDRVRRLKEGSTAIQWRNGQRDAIALLRVHGTEMAVEKQELSEPSCDAKRAQAASSELLL